MPSHPPLLVFADDWGRHPSSAQHLVRHLLAEYQVHWVNTIGTRPPRFDRETIRRGLGKLRHWSSRENPEQLPANLTVHNPKMWPWLARPFDRRLNQYLLMRQLEPVVRGLPEASIAITTLPIVADLLGRLPVAKWVYYCVDDFGQWPGLDRSAMTRMERVVIEKADVLIAASESLRDRLASFGRESHLLTHGVDVEFWRNSSGESPVLANFERPLVVFWGVIDRRLDTSFLRQLSNSMTRGTIVLVGPEQNPDPALLRVPRVQRIGQVPFDELPAIARAASVLVMPYVDAPVTRAMQPLKLKEYLATGKPTVVRDLPANRAWADALDLARTADEFAASVLRRIDGRLPADQVKDRERLLSENWQAKAGEFSRMVWSPLSVSERGLGGEVSARRRAKTSPPNPLSEAERGNQTATILDARVLSGSGGGPDKTLINSPPFLARAGYRMLCVYLHDPNDPGFEVLRQKAAANGVELISVPDRGPFDWRVVTRLVELCRRERVAVWHGHDYKTNLLGLVLKRFHPMRLVTTVHGWVHQTSRTPVYYWLDRQSLRFYERVFCVSDDLLAACRTAGVPKSRCVLLENGIDVERNRRSRSPAEARARLGWPERFTIGAVGRLSPEKGFDILIRAVDRLIAAGRDIQLLIVGEGSERESLQRLTRDDRIRLPGYRADLGELYEAFDLFALSSHREGLPNALLEAMAYEVPVVSTNVNGVPRLVTHGESGELVPAGSVELLAQALGRLMDDVELRGRYATIGRRVVEEQFSFAARMERLAKAYDEMLGYPESRAGEPVGVSPPGDLAMTSRDLIDRNTLGSSVN